jgi:uncharacterized protein
MQPSGTFARVQFVIALVLLIAIPAIAQGVKPAPPGRTSVKPKSSIDGDLPDRDKLNADTVTIITAPVGGAFAAMGSDMVRVLDDGDSLRVLPVIGKGSVQNLIDIMLLKNIDMGFVVSDAIDFVKTEYKVPDLQDRVRYVAKLFNNDLHIVARKNINSIRDLQGKKIFSERNLGYFSVRSVFSRLNITADIDFRTDDVGGLQKFIKGEADAWIVSAGKVAPIVANIKNDSGEFHLVPIPYEPALHDIYLPSTITNAEYPNLVAPEETVPTVAASTLLAVYNWPEGSERYNRVAKFVDALFGKIDQLQQPGRHPKWRDISLGAKVPGLQRFKASEDWLTKQWFDQFVQERKLQVDLKSPEQKALLFRQFQDWLNSQPATR